MAEKQVVFLEAPRQGFPVRFSMNGQEGRSSPARSVQSDPRAPGWISVDTESGSRYVGQVAGNQTVMGGNFTQMIQSPRLASDCVSPPTPYPNAGVCPPGLNWGAFLLCPFWGMAHSVWVALLAFIPAAGWIVPVVMLIKGNELAWQNRRFRDYQEFYSVQRAWLIWGVVIDSLWIVASVALWFAGMLMSFVFFLGAFGL